MAGKKDTRTDGTKGMRRPAESDQQASGSASTEQQSPNSESSLSGAQTEPPDLSNP